MAASENKSNQRYRALLDALYKEHESQPSLLVDLPISITKCVHHDKSQRVALLAHLPAKEATATNVKPNLADGSFRDALAQLSETFPPGSYGIFTAMCIIDGVRWRFVYVPEGCCDEADIPRVAELWKTLDTVPPEFRGLEMQFRVREMAKPLKKMKT